MRTSTLTCLCLLFILLYCDSVDAKEWREIVPMKSTRWDVTRILGVSPDANNIRARYYLADEEVYIVFSNNEKYSVACVKEMPDDIVLLIQITSKKDIPVNRLKLDPKKYRKFDPSEPKGVGYEGYISETDGLAIRAFKGVVKQFSYFAAKDDQQLCREYYSDPEWFVRILTHLPGRPFTASK